MSYFIKEVNRDSEEFENFLNDEEFYAFETMDNDYINFFKKIKEYTNKRA